jgi:hypothetical protein
MPDEVLDVLAADGRDVRHPAVIEEGREPGERVEVRLGRVISDIPDPEVASQTHDVDGKRHERRRCGYRDGSGQGLEPPSAAVRSRPDIRLQKRCGQRPSQLSALREREACAGSSVDRGVASEHGRPSAVLRAWAPTETRRLIRSLQAAKSGPLGWFSSVCTGRTSRWYPTISSAERPSKLWRSACHLRGRSRTPCPVCRGRH